MIIISTNKENDGFRISITVNFFNCNKINILNRFIKTPAMKKIDLGLTLILVFAFASASFGQVGPYFGGSTCATAVPIEAGEGYITNDFLGDDWYYYVATCDGELEITNCTYGDNKQVIIYSGSCGSLIAEKTADGDDCSTNDVDGAHAMLAGDTAFIQIDDTWDEDDLVFDVVFENPECPQPLSVDCFTTEFNEIFISWFTAGSETEWLVIYGISGFDPYTEGDTVLVTDGPVVVLSDLDELTCYEYYVVPDCGVDVVSCLGPTYSCCTPESLLDIEGTVYFDENENGIQDIGELGLNTISVISDPAGVLCSTGGEGQYITSSSYLDDGVFEIYPELEYWGISSDSLVYTLAVDIDYEARDSLDFGLYPDTLIYDLNTEFTGGWPRCNHTINYFLNIQNTGTLLASGLVHLELDDSLSYISASMTPDSVVGQHIYWYYEDLYYFDYELIIVQVGTPDGVEDTVSSMLTVEVDSAGVEMYSIADSLNQVISCAYDPNDKTPTPLGDGEYGNIPPSTESIEYLIRFQNTGTDTAFNVIIKDQLDPNVNWHSLTPIAYSHDMTVALGFDGEVRFTFNDIMLPDSNVNEVASHGFVKYKIDLNEGLALGTSIYNTANIYFDFNPAIVTNTTVNTLHVDNVSVIELINERDILVYPNPFRESTTVYFSEGLSENSSLQIVDLLGNQVYFLDRITGNSLEIQSSTFNAGVYILVVQDSDTNEVYSKKIVVN
jgi:uncharacterized repeat protein (TIGR01451 family)